MRFLLAISLLAACVGLASCELRGNTSAAKTPPPPTAVAAPPPTAPPQPISSPQTDIQLPAAQPVSQEALATIQTAPAEPKPPDPQPEPARPATRRPTPPVTPPPKPEAPAPPAVETPPAQPPAPTEEAPRLQPVYPEEERRRILGEIERRRGDIAGILRGINLHRLAADKKSVIGRIHSFMDVADDAARRGDLRSADSLSQRALILAQELASGR